MRVSSEMVLPKSLGLSNDAVVGFLPPILGMIENLSVLLKFAVEACVQRHQYSMRDEYREGKRAHGLGVLLRSDRRPLGSCRNRPSLAVTPSRDLLPVLLFDAGQLLSLHGERERRMLTRR
jgi:hypothetical protein